jgi:DNA-binding beta-propeller fold protein YncE
MNGHRRVGSIVLLLLCLGAAAARARGDEAGYTVVPGWPHTLPDGYRFGPVSAVAPDGRGAIFVFHRGEHPILVFNRAGEFLRSFGDGRITKAHGLRFDSDGNLWTTDVGSHTVRKFSPHGDLLLTLGREGNAGDAPDQFDQPADVGFGPRGDVYVADGYGNSRVVKYSKDGKFIKTGGSTGSGDGQFHLVHAVVVGADGRVYVGDRENNRIQVFDPDGGFLAKWTECGAPFGLYLDARRGRFLVADGRAHRCLVIRPGGDVAGGWGSRGREPGEFDLPHSIAMDSDGAVYVSEITGQRVQKFIER